MSMQNKLISTSLALLTIFINNEKSYARSLNRKVFVAVLVIVSGGNDGLLPKDDVHSSIAYIILKLFGVNKKPSETK